MAAELEFPMHFKRQFAGPLDPDSWMTTAERATYLSNPLRWAGQQVYDKEENLWYAINSTKDGYNLLTRGEGGSVAEDVTYAELKILVDGNNLTQGLYYRITDFQTIHKLNECTSADPGFINTGPVEPLMVLAVSSSKLSPIAFSETYPNDVIRYDFTSNLCEDGVTPRKGKITFRRDETEIIEFHYDWRHVKFRRWAVTATAWSSTTSYSKGATVLYSGIIYAAYVANTNILPTVTTNRTGAWMPLCNDQSLYAWKKSGFTVGNRAVTVNTATYADYYTLNKGDTMTEASNQQHVFNIVFGKVKPGHGDASNYNNFVFAGGDLVINKNISAINAFNSTLHGFNDLFFIQGPNFENNLFLDGIVEAQFMRNVTGNLIKRYFRWNQFTHDFHGNCVAAAIQNTWCNREFNNNYILTQWVNSLKLAGAFTDNIVYHEQAAGNNELQAIESTASISNCTIWQANDIRVAVPVSSKPIHNLSNIFINLRNAARTKCFYTHCSDLGQITTTELV